MTQVTMLVPSRGRPQSVRRMGEAWIATQAVNDAQLVWLLDGDDPGWARYMRNIAQFPWMRAIHYPQWMPMVPKLNDAAAKLASGTFVPHMEVIGFMGDDHIPRGTGWPLALAAAHISRGPGIFYGRDGFQDIKLPTWWAMSAEVIRRLGCMVPGGVEHLYCDNIVMQLGRQGRCLHYLPSVMIEHMHPVAGKGEVDPGYERVNSPDQYEKDRQAYLAWLERDRVQHGTILRELARGV